MVDRPRVLSLCAGIGGLDLGIGLAFPNARTVCFVEREAAACEILASRMEEGRLAPAPIWTDLRTFDGAAWGQAVDLICAGYPCQPFSVAGSRKGSTDSRHLWPEVLRVIKEVNRSGNATSVILENVQGHTSKGLDSVLLSLTSLGYRCAWGVVGASQAGAPHRRNRVFVLGTLDDSNIEGPQRWCGPIKESSNERAPWPPGPTDDWGDVPKHLRPAVEPPLRGVAHGLSPHVDQLRALGNAVVPQQAALAIRELLGRLPE